jgi:chromosome segregation ATPase
MGLALYISLLSAVNLGVNENKIRNSRKIYEEAKRTLQFIKSSKVYDSEAAYVKAQKKKCNEAQKEYNADLLRQKEAQAQLTISTTELSKTFSIMVESKAESQIEDRLEVMSDRLEKRFQAQFDDKIKSLSEQSANQIKTLQEETKAQKAILNQSISHLKTFKEASEAQKAVLDQATSQLQALEEAAKIQKTFSDQSAQHFQELEEKVETLQKSHFQLEKIAAIEEAQSKLQSKWEHDDPNIQALFNDYKTRIDDHDAELKKARAEQAEMKTDAAKSELSPTQIETLAHDIETLKNSQLSHSDLTPPKADLSSQLTAQQLAQVNSYVTEATTQLQVKLAAGCKQDFEYFKVETRQLLANVPRKSVANGIAVQPVPVQDQEFIRLQTAVAHMKTYLDKLNADGDFKTRILSNIASLQNSIALLVDDVRSVENKAADSTKSFEDKTEALKQLSTSSTIIAESRPNSELLHTHTRQIQALQKQFDEHKEQAETLARNMRQTSSRISQAPEGEDSFFKDQKPVMSDSKPERLTAKQIYALASVDPLLSRVNTLETTFRSLLNNESGDRACHVDEDALSDIKNQLGVLRSAMGTFVKKEEIEVISLEVAKARADLVRLDESQRKKIEDRINTTRQLGALQNGLNQYATKGSLDHVDGKVAEMNKGIEALEHSLRALTVRYNSINTEHLARHIASITNPIPARLSEEQIRLKKQIDTFDSKMNTLQGRIDAITESINALKVPQPGDEITKDSVDQIEKRVASERDRLQKDIERLEESIDKLKKEPQGDSTKLDDLVKQLNEHALRLNTIDGRLAHKNNWRDDEDDDKGENASFINQSDPHSQPQSRRLKHDVRSSSVASSAESRRPRGLLESQVSTPRSMPQSPKNSGKRGFDFLESPHKRVGDQIGDMIVYQRRRPTSAGGSSNMLQAKKARVS